jgi:hypothetical protein
MLILASARLVPAAPVPANVDTAVLAQVPAGASIVVYLHGLEHTKGRLITMVKNALPDLAPMIQDKIEESLKTALEGRQIKGVAKDGPIFLVLPELPRSGQGIPKLAKIIAVTNYADFRDGILTDEERKSLKPDKAGYEVATIEGQTAYFIDRMGYAIVTNDKGLAEQFLKKQPGLDTKLSKETTQKLLACDVAAYVDMVAVNKEFGPQIKQFRPLIKFFIQQMAAQSGQQAAQIYEAFFDGAFQLLEDSRVFLAAGDFRPEGLALTLSNQMGADTKIGAFLKDAKPGPLEKLGTLTAGQLGYMGVELQPEFFKVFGPLLQGYYDVGNEKEGKAIRAAWDELAAAGPQSWLMDYNMPVQGVQVWTYKDPARAAAAQIKLFQAFQSGDAFQGIPLKAKPEIKTDAETYHGFKLNSVRMTWDFDKFAEKLPQGGKEMAEMMKAFMGDAMNSWFGTDGKVYVSVTAKDWPAAQKLLAAYLDGQNPVGKEKVFQEARRNLPAKTTLLMLVDTPQYLQAMAKVFGPMFKAQGVPITIPEFKAPKGKSFTGFALTLRPEVMSFDLWVPVTTVSEIKKMVEQATGGPKIQ